MMFCLSSCQEERNKLKEASESISNASNVVSKAKEAQEESNKLRDIEPLTNAELKNWLPESVDGYKRTGFKVGATSAMNIASIEGTFEKDDTKVEVKIIDGAGPVGSSIIMGLNMMEGMEIEEENEKRHLKTVTKNGLKARQTYQKKRNDTKVEFVLDKRFAVEVKSKNMDTDKTWGFIEKLNLNDLTNL